MNDHAPTPEEVFAQLHPPSEMDTRGPIPEWPLLWRGLAFAVMALVALRGAIQAARWSWVAWPLAAVLGLASLLSAWAAAIHLTGGEKFDDHPFI